MDKALQVMQALAAPPGEWGVAELARQVGQPGSVVHSILQTFVLRGFAEQEPRTRLYRLGNAVFALASASRPDDLREVARGPMQVLANATGECAYLLVPSGKVCVTISRAEPPEVLRVTTEVGSFSPLHAGSNPKAILAFLPPDEVQKYLDGPLSKVAANTPTDPEVLSRQLAEIRELGYAYTEEELFDGIAGVAAPIFNRHGNVVGSVGIGALVPRVRANRDLIVRRVLSAAWAISTALGYHQPFKG